MTAEDRYYNLIIGRFVLITFAISWSIWGLLTLTDTYLIRLWIAVLGLYGPSIAGMFLAYRHHGTYWQHYLPKWYHFLPIFLISAFMGIRYMQEIIGTGATIAVPLDPVLMGLIIVCSLLSAYFLSTLIRAPPGFETRNQKPLQLQMGMLVFAIVLPFVIGVISYSIQRIVAPGTTSGSLSQILQNSFYLPQYLVFFSFIFSGATNEEIGWRGYLTPKLLERYSPLTTGLIVGLIWSLWHFPLHLTGFYGDGAGGIWFRLMWNIPLGVVFTWYYIKSGYNLLGAILLHGAYNLFSYIGSYFVIPAYIVMGLIVTFESKMWINRRDRLSMNKFLQTEEK